MRSPLADKERNGARPFSMRRIIIAMLIATVATLAVQYFLTGASAVPMDRPALRLHADVFREPAGLKDFSGMLDAISSGTAARVDAVRQDSGEKMAFVKLGQSPSAWWIRVRLVDEPDPSTVYVLSIMNPTLKTVALHVPSAGADSYEALHAGWGSETAAGDVGYLYPAFQLRTGLHAGSVLYLRVGSPFSQNHTISVDESTDFTRQANRQLLAIGVLLSIYIMICMNILVYYSLFHEWLFLVLFGVAISSSVYLSALLGIFRVWAGAVAGFLVSRLIIFSILSVLLMHFFLSRFLDYKSLIRHSNRLDVMVFATSLTVVILACLGFDSASALLAPLLTLIYDLFSLIVAIAALRRGVRQAGTILCANAIVFIGILVLQLRVFGVIRYSFASMVAFPLTLCAQTLILHFLLWQRVGTVKKERETAQLRQADAEANAIATESAWLQAQIRPHFLFNALSIISSMIRIDTMRARELLLDLSNYLRHTYDSRNLSRYVGIEEELDYINTYLRIEKARFSDALEFRVRCDGTEGLMVPPLILQPLVENAIRHGIRAGRASGSVELEIVHAEGQYTFSVTDDGTGMTPDEVRRLMSEQPRAGDGIGIPNIRRRLQRLYGTDLTIESAPGRGTSVRFAIPDEATRSQGGKEPT